MTEPTDRAGTRSSGVQPQGSCFRRDMIEMTETERREMNERLARAMGWDFIPHPSEAVSALEPDRGEWYTPKGRLYGDVPPDFTRDPAASRELVGWVAVQDVLIRYNFSIQIAIRIRNINGGYEPGTLEILTASPLLIAQAADAAIGGNNER